MLLIGPKTSSTGSPVTEHVDHNASSVLLSIIPTWSLGRLVRIMPGKYPVSKFSTDGENISKKSLLNQSLKLADAGKPEFVLHRTVLQFCIFAKLGKAKGFFGSDCGRFFTVNRLPAWAAISTKRTRSVELASKKIWLFASAKASSKLVLQRLTWVLSARA